MIFIVLGGHIVIELIIQRQKAQFEEKYKSWLRWCIDKLSIQANMISKPCRQPDLMMVLMGGKEKEKDDRTGWSKYKEK